MPFRQNAKLTSIILAIAVLTGGAVPALTASAQSSGAQASEPAGYVYATSVESGAAPNLTFLQFGPEMTGVYSETQDDAFFDGIYQSGGGTITKGRLVGTFNGNVFTGYWYEDQGRTGVQRECDPPHEGERIYGRVTLRFSADRKSFTGLHSTCDTAPEDAYFASWKGTLTRIDP